MTYRLELTADESPEILWSKEYETKEEALEDLQRGAKFFEHAHAPFIGIWERRARMLTQIGNFTIDLVD